MRIRRIAAIIITIDHIVNVIKKVMKMKMKMKMVKEGGESYG